MEEIDLSANEIQVVGREAFFHLPELTRLDLGYNGLLGLEPDSLVQVDQLEELYLRANNVSDIRAVQRTTQELRNLRSLDLSRNLLTSVPTR